MASRLRSNPALVPAAGMAALAVIGVLVLAHLTRGSTFYADEWDWILHRRHGGLGTFLAPHEEHLSIVPLAVYRLLFATAGIDHYGPYLAVTIAAQIVVGTLVFAYGRPRVGPVAALGAAALILFFGPGSIDFLWAFQMAWLFAVAAGIAGLLALDRRDRPGDVLACVLMAVALGSSGPGLAVALGLTIEIVWTRGRRALWMAGIPLGLYALWWIFYQQAGILGQTFLHVLTFTANAAASAVTALTGLLALDPASDSTTFHAWGPTVLALALAGLAWRLRVLWPGTPRVWALLGMTLAFWLITALGRGAFQAGPLVLSETGDEGRYLYVGAVLVLVLVLELARGVAVRRPAAALLGVVFVAALSANLGALRQQAAYLRSAGAQTAAYLGTLDMTRGVVAANFDSAGFLLGIVPAGEYFAAQRELGTPAASSAALSAAGDTVRYLADRQLAGIDHVILDASTQSPGAAPPVIAAHPGEALASAGACVRVTAAPLASGAVAGVALALPAGGLLVRALGGPASVTVRRFAARWGALGTLRAGPQVIVHATADHAGPPWQVQISPSASVLVCGSPA